MSGLPLGRIRVKICGLTHREDAEQAIALGADALGFNLFDGSKRYLCLEENSAWIKQLPPFVTKVAVLVNVSLEQAQRVAEDPAIDLVQFHGDEDEGYCREFARLGRPFFKALRLENADSIQQAAAFSTRNILVDAHVAGAYGGTGARINVELAAELARQHPSLALMLAGGLTPDNVAAAVRSVLPYGVDVASGVESSPGRKSAPLMHSFIQAAHSALS